VVEPTGCGLGGDAFALVWFKGRLHGLNANGHAPAA
jgi:gamma-glutamyltranspeptidase/glutathione hydrolase